ncbi:MAG: glycerate-2-kinase family protein, partial [Actinomycetota bacterium]|nr:glycerate-2-kinase family protein [Actinomycetota bacterium]
MAVGLFDPAVLETDPERRRPLLQVLAASLESVEPESAVHRWAQREGEEVLELGSARRVILVAFGKASLAMVRGLQGVLAGKQISGLVVAPEPPPLLPPPLAREGGRAKRGREGALAAGFELITAGHPTPDGHSRQAAARALELAGGAQAEDLVVCLISGGGSALLELPAPGLDLHGLVTTTELLLRSGADIHQLNAVRKHLSAVKGGRLAQAAGPARLVTLVVSDVVGNPLDVIASGPTVPDPTTFHDALAVLDRFRLRDAVPQAVLAHLETGAAGRLPETPKDDAELPRQELVVVADG